MGYKNKVIGLVTEEPTIIQNIIIIFISFVVFISGFGRYRITVFVITYYIVSVILKIFVPKVSIRYIFYPLGILMLYLDFKQGQIFPVFANTSLFFTLLVFAIADLCLNNTINLLVENLTNGRLFTFCQSCNYENFSLVNKCQNCNFTPEFYCLQCSKTGDMKKNNDHYLVDVSKDKILSKKAIKLLTLGPCEKIYDSLRITPFKGVYKNKGKIICKFVVVTNLNFILLDYRYNLRGWSMLDKIPLIDITESKVIMERHGIADAPILKIKVSNGDELSIFCNHDETTKEAFSNISSFINKNAK